jgi:cation diffusion facilitator family transporter
MALVTWVHRKGGITIDAGEKVALVAIGVNFILFIVKYAAAVFSGSIALKAESFHTFADLIASLTVFAGLKIAKRKSKMFPYGLYKIENMFSVIISFVIFYTGYEILLEAKHMEHSVLQNPGWAILSILFSILVTFLFSRYEKKVGEKLQSPILLADAAHIHIDVLSNVVVLISLISSLMGYYLEQIAAFIVVLFIIKTGWQIAVDGLRVLLDASVDYETLSKVAGIIVQTPQVIEMKTLTGRNSGQFKFIEANIVLKTHDFDKAHFIAEGIESHIKKEIRHIDQVLIQYEPVKKEEIIYAVPLSDDQALVGEHFGEAKYFMLVTFKAEEKKASKVEVLDNPYSISETSKGILTAEFLIKKMVDAVFVKKDFGNKGPAYVFSNANIEVIVTDALTMRAVFEKIDRSL